MTTASSLPPILHLFLLPDDATDDLVLEPDRFRLAAAIRVLKRMGFRFTRVFRTSREVDCVAASMLRRRNVSRCKPTELQSLPSRLDQFPAQLIETNAVVLVPTHWARQQFNMGPMSLNLLPYSIISIDWADPLTVRELIGLSR